jgi:ABC-type iron transport system FetAB ATPase subunit
VGPLDLTVDAGECVGLTGPSAAGKTLLLRAVADLDPHEGRIALDGTPSTSLAAPAWRRRVAMLPAESQWWHDTIRPHFGETTGEVDAWLADLGFDADVMGWPIARLSSGERQRLAIARVLALGPSALLLDEPTANLDADNVERAEAVLERYRTDRRAAILWVSHSRDQLRRVAARRYRLKDGTLIEESDR